MSVDLDTFDRSKIRDLDIYGAVKRDPYGHYAGLSQTPPFYIMVDGYPQAMVTRFADTRAVLEDYARFSNRKQPWAGTKGFYYFNSLPVVNDRDPPDHARLRRLMAPAFSPRRLAAVEAGVRDFVERRLDALAAREDGFDLVDDLATPIATHTLFALVLDLPEADWTIFTGLSDAQRAAFDQPSPDERQQARYREAWEHARTYCETVIEARRRTPTDDLVSHIVQSHDSQGRITTDELFGVLFVLYTAGIGGLINSVAWPLWRLARHPDQRDLLRRRPELVLAALTESLRMDPSSFASLRYAVADFEFEGLRLYQGMPVHTLSASGNYDPALFDDPLRFDITRQTDWKNLTSFGHGIHHCIGNALARLTGRIAIAQTIQRFPAWRLQDPDFMPMVTGVAKQRAPVSIPVRFD